MPLELPLPNDSTVTHISGEEISELIKAGKFEELLDKMLLVTIDFAFKLLIAIIIFIVGRWIIKRLVKLSEKIMTKRKIDFTLKGFLSNLISFFLFLVLFIAIINAIGTKTFSIAAIIGSAGLAIGLAVKDNLANFAGGVMLLFNKPFKVGEYIEAQGLAGTVRSIGILYTTLTTSDNKTINIPNGPLSTGSITNISRQPTRRVNLTVAIEFGTDIEAFKKLLLEIAHAHPLILKDPAPFCRMTNIGDHGMEFTVRVWTANKNFWTVTFDLNEEICRQIEEKGFVIPFNQLSVHIEK